MVGERMRIWLFSLCLLCFSPTWSKAEALPDFKAYQHTLAKKKAFFHWLRPMAVSENKRISAQREHLLRLQTKYNTRHALDNNDQAWMKAMILRYKSPIQDWKQTQTWKALLTRIDIIPVKLVLAQAANESAWGTSRFAREGLNLFGMWCFTKGCGLVPKHRLAGKTHEVTLFPSVQASVSAYMHVINTREAYKPLRKMRASMRAHHLQPTAMVLVKGLEKYSELGKVYIDALQLMLRKNNKLMEGS